jgi:lysozyme
MSTTLTVLKRRLKGPPGRQLQEHLNRLGSSLRSDGDFGPATEEAVRRFQGQHGLAVDGVVGPETSQKLLGTVPAAGPKSPASVSSELVEAVARWEGGQGKDGMFHPYWDKTGRVWTIGYGHTGPDVTEKTPPWSAAEAKAALGRQLNEQFLPSVRRLGLPLNQKQTDALTSFAYNLGTGPLGSERSLGKALRGPNWRSAAPEAMLLYDHSGKPPRRIPGLTTRRKWEGELFKGGTYAH